MQRVSVSDYLSDDELASVVADALDAEPIDGKRLLFIIPDSTRSMPMASMFRSLCAAAAPRAAKVDFLVALGTHPPMSETALCDWVGVSNKDRHKKYAAVGLFNHDWRNKDALAQIGVISSDMLERISGGLMRGDVPVSINKRVLDYDFLCVVGPVFPHEVVGFSGGNKYFLPGVAGEEILNMFHWLGALISNPVINGTKDTPVREVIDTASAFIKIEKRAFCLNVSGKRCKAIYYGPPEEAWSVAADLAATTHIVYKDHPFKSVLAMAPKMYDEIWVAGKCMYKLEPVVADGGELIIYGPHIHEVSVTHGDLIRRIGYHTRDYFLAQMDKFDDIPGGILAHSTHVRGIGTFRDGQEHPRVQVTLATGISEAECKAINLGYRDPTGIAVENWRNYEGDGMLLVENAGEILYRLRGGNPQPRPLTPIIAR